MPVVIPVSDSENEFEIHPSWWSFVHLLSMGILGLYLAFFVQFQIPANLGPPWAHQWFPVVLLCFGGGMILLAVLKRYSWRYSLRNDRVGSREGIIARREASIRLRDVRSVYLEQSISDRLMSTGSIRFASAASDNDPDVVWRGIDEPAKFRDQIQAVIDRMQHS